MSRISNTFKKFPKTFWIANLMELFERWAYYGIFAVLALYLTNSRETGALGFTQAQKGTLMGTFGAIVYFLPIITGAIADKVGFKKVLSVSFIIMILGYASIPFVKNYETVFLVFLFAAVGAALFKPIISATISKCTTSETASIGFGFFYMIVNIGAFIGPVFAAKFREISWDLVFYMSAAVHVLNLILVFFFYKEPDREPNTDRIGRIITGIFINIWNALKDLKFLVFLIIIIGFWAMYFQLFYTLPNFIDQWVDTAVIYNFLYKISPLLANSIGTKGGTIAPEMIINIDALYIILFQILISGIVARFKPLNSMIYGIFISSLGIAFWFVTQNGAFLFVSILVFAVGEMASSPKILEYIGKIAPRDKVSMYLGASYLPMAAGNFIAGILSGSVYGKIADKLYLLAQEMKLRGIAMPEISESFTKTDYFNMAAQKMNLSDIQLTNYLWAQYQPGNIWIVFSGIGLFTVIALFIFDRFFIKGNLTIK